MASIAFPNGTVVDVANINVDTDYRTFMNLTYSPPDYLLPQTTFCSAFPRLCGNTRDLPVPNNGLVDVLKGLKRAVEERLGHAIQSAAISLPNDFGRRRYRQFSVVKRDTYSILGDVLRASLRAAALTPQHEVYDSREFILREAGIESKCYESIAMVKTPQSDPPQRIVLLDRGRESLTVSIFDSHCGGVYSIDDISFDVKVHGLTNCQTAIADGSQYDTVADVLGAFMHRTELPPTRNYEYWEGWDFFFDEPDEIEEHNANIPVSTILVVGEGAHNETLGLCAHRIWSHLFPGKPEVNLAGPVHGNGTFSASQSLARHALETIQEECISYVPSRENETSGEA